MNTNPTPDALAGLIDPPEPITPDDAPEWLTGWTPEFYAQQHNEHIPQMVHEVSIAGGQGGTAADWINLAKGYLRTIANNSPPQGGLHHSLNIIVEQLAKSADSLEAFHAKPVEGEPVAWRWEGRGGAGYWERRITAHKPDGGEDDYCRNVEPLYLAALQSPPPVVSWEADMRAIVEALGFEPDNHHNAAKCPYCTPPRVAPVVEEGRREAERTELCYLIERMCPDKPESNLGNPLGSQVEALADAILALTPVEVVGEDDTKVLELSVSAEQAYANRYPENAEMIARIIDGYRFDTPSDRARAHEVARAMAGHPRATPATAQGDVREALEILSSLLAGVPYGTPDGAYLSVDMTHGEGRSIRDAIDHVAGCQAEAERQDELAKVYRRAQLTAEEKLCREEANAIGWRKRAERLEQKLATLKGQDNG